MHNRGMQWGESFGWRLLSLSLLLGLASFGRGWRDTWIPGHPATTRYGYPVIANDTDYCTDGKWIFRGGVLLTLSSLDDISEQSDTVRDWYLEHGWQPVVNRGVTRYRPVIVNRATHRFWPNINLESDVLLFGLPDQPVARALKRYRLHICPPTVLLS